MTLRATQFCDVVITGPGPVVLYTVPTGFRIIVRSINLYNPETSVNPCTVTIGTSPTITSRSLDLAGTPNSQWNFQPWIVVNPGQTLQGWAGSGKHCHIVISGSLLYV